MTDNNNNWNANVLDLLEKVRSNAYILSDYHRKRFIYFKSYSKYFDIPILVFSSVGASFSVGTQDYLEQSVISAVSCFIGLIISIITSIKLYLNLEDSMMNEMKMSKEFYTLSIEIYRIIHLEDKDREIDGVSYLNKKYGQYIKLIENSNILRKRFKNDLLVEIDKSMLMGDGDSLPDTTPPETPKIQKKNLLIIQDEKDGELNLNINTDIQQSEV